MRVLIVYAHPEPKSFNRALLDSAVRSLAETGHEVAVSDLYADGFEPLASAADFQHRADPGVLIYDREQRSAVEAGNAFSPDIAREIERLLWADLVILQFPLWWFSLPAILKGWVDRVFVNGIVYGGGKWYDRGGLRGRRAMLAISTGCYPSMCGPDGINGDLDTILWHIQNGMLRFAGFDVLPPFVAWSAAYKTDAQRRLDLDEYGRRLSSVFDEEPLFFHPRDDFGADWRLKPGVQPRAAGQRPTGTIIP